MFISQIKRCAVTEDEKSNAIDTEALAKDNKTSEDNARDVTRMSETVQNLIGNYESQNELVKAKEFIKSTAVSYNDSKASARLWSSIAFVQEDTVTSDNNQIKTIQGGKKSERSSQKHVTIDVTHRREKYESRKGKETMKDLDEKKLRTRSKQSGSRAEHRANSCDTKASKYLRKENQSPLKIKSLPSEPRQLSEDESTTLSKQEKTDRCRENVKVSHRETNANSKAKWKNTKFYNKATRNEDRNNNRTRDREINVKRPNIKMEPKSFVAVTSQEKTTDQVLISTGSTKTDAQQSAVRDVTSSSLNNAPLKTSPRDEVISPRECNSSRVSGKGKRRSPRSYGKASPRDKLSPRDTKKTKTRDAPKPRRNKKKRSTRVYTDIPNEKTETICAKDDENPTVNVIRDLQQSVKNDVKTENLVKIATVLVNTAVSEAMEIVRKKVGSVEKVTDNEEIKKVASTVLKHVFYIVCYKWKLYYSHIQSTNLDSVKDTDDEKIDKDNLPQTTNINVGNNTIIWKNDNVAAEKLIVDNCTPLTDGETVKDELVHHIVGTTVSADHLETMSTSRTPERKSSDDFPVLKKSEPNMYLKEGQCLRLTKSEEMNLTTISSVKLPHGIETQNSLEGNTIHSSTCNLKEKQEAVTKRMVNMSTAGIATSEKGSGESTEAPASKTKTLPFTDNEAII